ncbi:MAG: protein phosphatase 2C domain-containing protein [Gammaproteobacteria bacterium]|nr:protein phosphatase 2C domain-containing protein [Gammaproteobacteria bacterium]MCW8922509.1 protein phosphatase 2C domain-containing protein [Gammaproteobacteria bacterium]
MTSDEDITSVNMDTLRSQFGDDISSDDIIPLSVLSEGQTDVGKKRLHNEDSFYSSDDKCLWFVADGMGGHNAGDFASQSLVNDVEAFYNAGDSIEESAENVEAIIQQTNLNLIKKASNIADDTVIGATIALLVSKDNRGIALWAGDSRIYRVRSGKIEQITTDHSLVNDMVKEDLINAEDAENHPDKNKITRAVGYDKDLTLDYRKLSILPGDRYILCSDGLSKELSDEEILSIAGNGSTVSTNQTLMQQALDRGGRDNVTIITIDFFKG